MGSDNDGSVCLHFQLDTADHNTVWLRYRGLQSCQRAKRLQGIGDDTDRTVTGNVV